VARLELSATNISPVMSETAGALAAINGASVEVKKHGEATKVAIYVAATGETQEANPCKTNARGEIPGFIEETGEQVDVVVTQTSFNPVTHTISAGAVPTGAWLELESLSAHFENPAPSQQKVQVRVIGKQAVMQGVGKIVTETLAVTTHVFTVPAAARPAVAQWLVPINLTPATRLFELKTNGEAIVRGASWGENTELTFTQVMWPLS
jgi:hypothetical protein